MPTVKPEDALAINDALSSMTRSSLTLLHHDELYGALGAAIAAVQACSRIAVRDVERPNRPLLPSPRLTITRCPPARMTLKRKRKGRR